MRSLQWDIFCKVIDNFGDIGVCWRLCKDLASRGHRVRLWVDDASALAWMAPDAGNRVEVLAWTQPLNVERLETAPSDVLIEAFGCDPAPELIAFYARIDWAGGQNNRIKPVWINLEYLTAEVQAERNHGLPSPVHSGPGAGWTKWFFYPGFSDKTGGLLRESNLADQQAAFDRKSWLTGQGLDWTGETLVSLFCYEPPALARLIEKLGSEGLNGQPVRLLVAAGRAERAVKAVCESKISVNNNQNCPRPSIYGYGLLSISYIPLLTQTGFDHLLWACDLNFVRGEDSLVRALWAGKPFVWQIYPQHDDAHHAKLDAFLDMLGAPPSLRVFHHRWNANTLADSSATTPPDPAQNLAGDLVQDLPDWQQTALAACARLKAQNDLTSRLIQFVEKTR